LLPVVTTENVEALTPLPHVTLELDPESVYVAGVCVDNVPAARRPPLVLDLIVALVGRLSRELVDVEPSEEVLVVLIVPIVVVVIVGEPDLSGYLIPLEGQEPALGALIGTNVPSMTEPLR